MQKFHKLSRAEMKNVVGGNGTCAWHDSSGNAICGLTKSVAQATQAYAGGNWCCDSCPSNLCPAT
jgi:hypothetical protein